MYGKKLDNFFFVKDFTNNKKIFNLITEQNL